jgi:hypothetical protein
LRHCDGKQGWTERSDKFLFTPGPAPGVWKTKYFVK